MIGIILESLVFLIGLVILISGKAALSRRIDLTGAPARAVGVWLMLFVPISISIYTACMGYWLRSLPPNRTSVSSIEFPVIYLLVTIFGSMALVGLAVFLIYRGVRSRSDKVYAHLNDTHIARSGQELGAFNDLDIQNALSSKQLLYSDHFYKEGMAQWLTLHQWHPRTLNYSAPLFWSIAWLFIVSAAYIGSSTFLVFSVHPGMTIDGQPLPSFLSLVKREEPPYTTSLTSTSRPAVFPKGITLRSSSPAIPKNSSYSSGDQLNDLMDFGTLMAQETTNGRPIDATAALKKLAEQGNPIAQFELGNSYLTGRNASAGRATFQQNLKLALEWYTKAARQGHLMSQLLVSTTLESGEAGRKSTPEAWAWNVLYIEKFSGDEKEQLSKHLRELEDSMSDQDKNEGKAFLAKLRAEGVR
jgi:hypothetical protein